MEGSLRKHIVYTDKQAKKKLEILMKQMLEKNPTLDGNMRDYANILQLVILSNLENLNSEMIAEGIDQKIRLEKLNAIEKKQYNILQDSNSIKKIEMLDENNNFKKLQ